ncbi:MAG: SUMF1/EgtB/PvdO family nonheme iron enzyme [Chitinivibrionales bacterium]|nr:SUMF1/EgtB/PvdO family nonheme iron enzyme [Chitinivibrionales bacterium]
MVNTVSMIRSGIIFIFLCVPVLSQMVSVPGGSFTMGSDKGEADESPRHQVALSPFKIDRFEVTHAQYDSCVKRGACTPAHYDDGNCLIWTGSGFKRVRVPAKYRNPDYPVVCVTWQQARQYCRAHGKELPSEAQWEYAALARSGNKYSWGNSAPSQSRCASPSLRRPQKNGSFQPNKWNIHDMTGNVWEWTNDRYQKDYYAWSVDKDPRSPGVGRYRVIRGGGWYSSPNQLRIKNRHWFSPTHAEVSIGFRCAK